MHATLLLAAALLGWGAAAEAEKLKAVRPAGTFSIVARDARTGELGVGVHLKQLH